MRCGINVRPLRRTDRCPWNAGADCPKYGHPCTMSCQAFRGRGRVSSDVKKRLGNARFQPDYEAISGAFLTGSKSRFGKISQEPHLWRILRFRANPGAPYASHRQNSSGGDHRSRPIRSSESAMRSRILCLLTSTAVVLHALLGCCAHHSHAGHGDLCGVPGTQQASVRHHCSCRHNHAEPRGAGEDEAVENSAQPRQGRDEPCNEPECQFVAVQRCDDIKQALSLPVWLPLNEAMDRSTWTSPLTRNPATVLSVHPPSAVSLHAAMQVWLL